tara:strand:- start:3421 stop:3831 length:411 start_codon:yes stop_codon:yes gene_type:complete
MNTSLPDYFESRTTELDHLRLPYNHKRWPYWFITTYEDTYQAYLSVGDFKTRTRLKFDYSVELRTHIIQKSFKKFRNSGVAKMKTFSVAIDHHRFQDIIVSADAEPLILLRRGCKVFERVDDYLTITRRWINDRSD